MRIASPAVRQAYVEDLRSRVAELPTMGQLQAGAPVAAVHPGIAASDSEARPSSSVRTLALPPNPWGLLQVSSTHQPFHQHESRVCI